MNIGLQMQALYRRFGDIDEVTVELHKELLAINIHNQAAEATVFLQGAQLTQYQPHKESPVIWLSPDCDYKLGSPLRGGIPICWPWFGDLDKNPVPIQQQLSPGARQAHGFVRELEWEVDSIKSINPDETELQMSLNLDATDLWPFACKLTMTFSIGKKLSLCFSVHNNDARPFVFSTALHSYFAIDDIDRVAIHGLDGKPYIDALDDWKTVTQRGDITIDREVDRVYETDGDTIQIIQTDTAIDSDRRRIISIVSKNSNNAVVWNPWIEKSKRLSQFGDLDYRQMICVESANVGRHSVTLQPGEHHSQLIDVISQVPE